MQIPKNILLDKEGQYCVNCFSGPIERKHVNNLTFYECLACHKISERSLVIDNNIVWWFDERGNYWHESVGVIVVNTHNKILCMLRQIYPFAYTIPAGHLDKGEKPKNAAVRELEEETGIKAGRRLKKIGKFDMTGDSCRRGSDHHKWNLYWLKVIDIKSVKLSDEASDTRWYSLVELKRKDNLTFALAFIIKKFGHSLIS